MTNDTAPYPLMNCNTGRHLPVPAEYRDTTPDWHRRNCYDQLRHDLARVTADMYPGGADVEQDTPALMHAVLSTGNDTLDALDVLTVRELVTAHTTATAAPKPAL